MNLNHLSSEVLNAGFVLMKVVILEVFPDAGVFRLPYKLRRLKFFIVSRIEIGVFRGAQFAESILKNLCCDLSG
jgi:hypothetical protein